MPEFGAKKGVIFKVVHDAMVVGGLRMGQGGVGQVLTEALQVWAKGFPTFYLKQVSFEGGYWTEKFEFVASS